MTAFVVAFALGGTAPEDRHGPSAVRLETQACPDNAIADAHCLIAHLPLNDERPEDRRTVEASLIVLPSASPSGARRAVFVLEGGPGLRATDAIAEFARDWQSVRQTHDLVVMNVRGLSDDGLWCRPEGAAEKRAAYTQSIFPIAMLERCRRAFEQRTDLTRYTSPIMARDIEALRRTLGYDRVGLIGYSYGTRLAQEYVRRFPAVTEAAVLLGPVQMDGFYPDGLATDTQAVFDMIAAACRIEEACARAYPDLADDFRTAAARLATGLRATVTYDGTRHDVTLARGVVTSWLRSRLYSMDGVATVPALIHAIATGDTQAIAQKVVDSQIGGYDGFSYGLWLTLTCTEDVRFIDLPAARMRTRGTLLADDRLNEQVAACRSWPTAELPPDFRRPVASSVPVLQITGGYDPATRPENGERIGRGFANGAILAIGNESHLFRKNWNDCIGVLAVDFLRRGGWRGGRPDTSCITRIPPTPFAVPVTAG